MLQAGVQAVALPVAVARDHHLVHLLVSVMRLSVLTVDDRPPSHLFHVKIAPCIAMIATRRSAPPAVIVAMIHAATAAIAAVVDVTAAIDTIEEILAGKKSLRRSQEPHSSSEGLGERLFQGKSLTRGHNPLDVF